jgi:hypothetical protein
MRKNSETIYQANQRGLLVGSKAEITTKHHLPSWHGKCVVILSIDEIEYKAMGQYPEDYTYTTLRITTRPSAGHEWMFYKLEDLKAI